MIITSYLFSIVDSSIASNPSEVENDQFIREWYTNEEFIKILYKSLNNSGMIIFQLGQMPNNNSPLDSHTMKWKTHLMALLETAGFKSIHIYSESHGLFSGKMQNLASVNFDSFYLPLLGTCLTNIYLSYLSTAPLFLTALL